MIPHNEGVLDLKAIFGRKPDLVIIDELAQTNPPGDHGANPTFIRVVTNDLSLCLKMP
jgi:hypothetical protein